MRKNDNLPIALIMFSGGRRVQLEPGATVAIRLNAEGAFGGAGLASASATLREEGTSAEYAATLALTSEALLAAIGTNASIRASLGVKITQGSLIQSTQHLLITIQNALQ